MFWATHTATEYDLRHVRRLNDVNKLSVRNSRLIFFAALGGRPQIPNAHQGAVYPLLNHATLQEHADLDTELRAQRAALRLPCWL